MLLWNFPYLQFAIKCYILYTNEGLYVLKFTSTYFWGIKIKFILIMQHFLSDVKLSNVLMFSMLSSPSSLTSWAIEEHTSSSSNYQLSYSSPEPQMFSSIKHSWKKWQCELWAVVFHRKCAAHWSSQHFLHFSDAGVKSVPLAPDWQLKPPHLVPLLLIRQSPASWKNAPLPCSIIHHCFQFWGSADSSRNHPGPRVCGQHLTLVALYALLLVGEISQSQCSAVSSTVCPVPLSCRLCTHAKSELCSWCTWPCPLLCPLLCWSPGTVRWLSFLLPSQSSMLIDIPPHLPQTPYCYSSTVQHIIYLQGPLLQIHSPHCSRSPSHSSLTSCHISPLIDIPFWALQ